jgi:RimJ/RimL family protein N-acetyltransferase
MAMDLSRLQLRTERLLLRPWRRSDLDIMAAWAPLDDPLQQTWNWTGQLRGMSLDFFFAAQQFDPAQHIWTVLTDELVIGLVSLHARDQIRPTLGISLSGSAIGQGYGREALSGFFDVYFDRWPRNIIRLEVALANRRAVGLYQALHFRETGRFWRDAGAAQRYAFLDQPTYRDVQHFFRWSSDACYQLCAQMELEAETWKRFMV